MRKIYIIVAAALSAGIALGYGAGQFGRTSSNNNLLEQDPNTPLYWVAPMDPNYRRDAPGKSPMGMDLVPVYPGSENETNADALVIDPAIVNNIGVRTEAVTVRDLAREIDTVGYVTIDENKTSHVHVRSAGWVEKLHHKALGEPVKKGEVIFELYSPDVVNAQTEFLQALSLKQPSLIQASKTRLNALGMSSAQITDLQKLGKIQQRISITAPQDGIIMALNIGEGMYITPSTTVFSLTDLSTVWVKAEIFEGQSNWVKEGQAATLTFPFLPGEKWKGTIDYVYPVVSPESRTVQARLSFKNADARLKPNMYGEIRLAASSILNATTIPREALIRTGKTDRVILALGDGKFRPAEVTTGQESGDFIEITAGLQEGENIVTSGQFLIDSEASTNSAYLRILGSNRNQSAETHAASGTINSITTDGIVNITHGPFETLGMPSMTMNFQIGDSVNITDFSAGDAIDFEVIVGDDGWYIITKATKTSAAG